MKKARIIYEGIEITNREGYRIEIMVDGEWGTNSFFPLVRRENASDEEDKNFVHYSIINKIKELHQLGYEISI